MQILKWSVRILLFVVVVLFLVPMATPAMAAPPVDWSKLDAALTQVMKAKPGGNFSVIIEVGSPKGTEKDNKEKGKEKGKGIDRANEALGHIRNAGGRAKNKLALIGGHTADLKWDAIAILSHNPRIRRISLDRPLVVLGPMSAPGGLASVYTQVVRAPEVWAMGYTGQGIGIAVIDSGVYAGNDIGGRLVARVDLVNPNGNATDPGGHGTHVAGIAAGNGTDSVTYSGGVYKGIAPNANIISIRVINGNGLATASSVIRGIQWAVQNRNTYNIRVINLSLGSPPQGSYKGDPVVTAAEVAWHAGIVVVSAAGNRGPIAGTVESPGIDPYSITVGALDDNMTVATSDDVIAWFSSRGPTPDNFPKPDLVAPGRRIVSLYSPSSYLAGFLLDRLMSIGGGKNYFRLSGTSQATPVVSGVVALMLEKNPTLKPNQIKFILKNTARPLSGVGVNIGGNGVADAYSAATTTNIGLENRGLRPTDAFAINVYPLIAGQPLSWKDPNYMGVNWSNLTWDNLTWDNLTCDNLTWDNLTWDNLTWDASANWDSLWASGNAWQSLADLD